MLKVNPTRSVARFDYWLLVIIVGLLAIGIMIIGTATLQMVPHQPLYYVYHQMIWATLGAFVLFIVANVAPSYWQRFGTPIYIVNLFFLILVLVHGRTALGAKRWIQIGPFPFQPSEFAKMLIILSLGAFLAKRYGELNRIKDLWLPILYTAVPMLLIIKQPDLGTALVFVGILMGMLYMAGAPLRNIILVFGGALAVMVFWVFLHLKFGIYIPMKTYQLDRLLVFINPYSHPNGAGYNIIQSKIAIGSGGLWGRGLSSVRLGQLSFLPENYTDFIFAVVGQELGFVGSITLLLLYLLLLWRGLYIARLATDPYTQVVAGGVVSMWAFHILVNAGMTMGIMPVTGVPLPFVSYGGSSLMTNAIAVGVLESIYRQKRRIDFNDKG